MSKTNEGGKKISAILEKLKNKFLKEGLTESEVAIKLLEIDSEFLMHSMINNSFRGLDTQEERVNFYLKYLDHVLDNLKF